ncbi:MAG: ABC transporter permease [Myxococcota bacterium]|jgi:tungstate transport system permease protein|nr:ABC transporter permease [Myxococcota bacterium]
MEKIADAFSTALMLLVTFDADMVEIVVLSLSVSFSAVMLAALVGLPFGAFVAIARFPGRGAVITLLNALMGLPPVVVGLVVYLMLSRSGPLGFLGWLFTPTAMVVAQFALITPLVAALSRQAIQDLWEEYHELLRSLDVGLGAMVATLIWDGRHRLLTTLLAGYGRAIAEVGAVIIVGGNIAHVTRVMTTAIALETSKGDLALALGLGIVLLLISLLVNTAAALSGRSTQGAPVQ